MNLCNGYQGFNHDEVCYESGACPVCSEHEDRDKDYASLKAELEDCKKDNARLEDELRQMEEPIIAALKVTYKVNPEPKPQETESHETPNQ